MSEKSMSAFAMGVANRDREPMVFDWDEAARRIVDCGAKNAFAGLAGDWGWTSGAILEDGRIPSDTYTYLSSTWATPVMEIDGNIEPCYRMQNEVPDWGAKTFWPKSARIIAGLDGGEEP